jgi:hypothetical protein
MPYLSSRGDAAHGVGGDYLCLNNAPVARGWALGWLDDDTIAFCNGADGWRVSVYDVPMQSIAPLPQIVSANAGYCGGGYASWWLGSQDATRGLWSTTGFRQPNAGLVGMGPDGSIAYRPNYHGAGPTLIHELDGTDWTLTDNAAEYLSSQGQRRVLWLEEGRPKVRNLPPVTCLDGTLWLAQAAFCGGQWWIVYISEHQGVVLHPFGSLVGYAHAPIGDAWPTMRALTDRILRVATSRTQGEQAGDVWVRDYDVLSGLVRDPWGMNEWAPLGRTDLSGAAPVSAPLIDYGPPLTRPVWFGWYKNLNPQADGTQGSCVVSEPCGLVRLSDGAVIATPADGEGSQWRTPSGEVWIGAQAYLDAPGPASVTSARAALRAKIDTLVTAAHGYPVVLVAQAYDRNGQWTNLETLVGMQVEYLDALRRYPNIVALVPFALDRPGGAHSHPALWDAWQAIGQRLHAPATLPLPSGCDVLYPRPDGLDTVVLSRTGTHRIMDIRVPPCPVPVRVRVELVEGSLHGQIDTMDGTRIGRSGKQRPVEIRP